MVKPHIALLLNGSSRQSDAARGQIFDSLNVNNITADQIHEIDDRHDIASLCTAILKNPPSLLIIGGGDGTVSTALHHLAGSDLEIGIIPLGTTNNFARSLQIPSDISEAIGIIKRCHAHPVDLGVVNGQHFANVVGIGLSTTIARKVSDGHKKRYGRLAYLLVGIQQILKHRAFTVTATDADGQLSSAMETHQLIIANGRFHAGRQIAQDVAVDNRELVLFALGGRGWVSFAWHTLDFYLGRRKKIVHGSYITGHKIVITTSRQELIEIDGETTGTITPLALSVHSRAVNIRYKL